MEKLMERRKSKTTDARHLYSFEDELEPPQKLGMMDEGSSWSALKKLEVDPRVQGIASPGGAPAIRKRSPWKPADQRSMLG